VSALGSNVLRNSELFTATPMLKAARGAHQKPDVSSHNDWHNSPELVQGRAMAPVLAVAP
jgi:hypothetical protein